MGHKRSSSIIRLGARGSALLAAALLAAGVFASLPGQANAATVYYDTNGATAGTGASATDWNSSNANWTTDPTGSSATITWPASGTGDLDDSDVVFSAGTNAPASYAINVAGSKLVNSITVAEGAIILHTVGSSAGTRTIGPGGITLDASSTTAGVSPVGLAINASVAPAGILKVVLAASQNWTINDAAANISVSAPLSGNATAGNTYTLTAVPTGAGGVLISGPITDGTAGGNLGVALAATGSGGLTLQGANAYTGGTIVSSGTLLLNNGGSLAHANITINGGAFASDATGGAITDNIADDADELISLSGSGVLDLTNLNFNLNVTGTQTQSEYVLANADVGSPNITGMQFLSTNLPAGWSISYTGTAANPNDIVLINGNASAVPEPASLALLGIGALGLIRRRRH